MSDHYRKYLWTRFDAKKFTEGIPHSLFITPAPGWPSERILKTHIVPIPATCFPTCQYKSGVYEWNRVVITEISCMDLGTFHW